MTLIFKRVIFMPRISVAAIFVLLILFSGFPESSRAAVRDGTIIAPATLRPLARWVEDATNTRIRVLPLAIASGRILKTSLGLRGVQQARAMAAYLPGQIIINNVIWDPESVRSQSYLVHEMVHHAQMLSGKRYPCPNAKEREAYTLQNRFLQEHDEDPMFGDHWIKRLSSCKKR